MVRVIVIHGPNLNLLGKREITTYGSRTLDDVNNIISQYAEQEGISVSYVQSNAEGDIIDTIHRSQEAFDFGIINPGAYSHYSLAIRDAISSIQIPYVEVHLSNIFSREEFRHKSVIAPVCTGSLCGFGYMGYVMALKYIIEQTKHKG